MQKKINSEKEWFILKDGNNFGPFAYLDVVNMLQEKAVYEYDFCWNEKFSGWRKISEVSDFSQEKIRELKTSGDQNVTDIFFRRRHQRTSYGCSLIVHNQKQVYKGSSFQISEGGAGVVIPNSTFTVGQNLYLHFRPGDSVPAFNAICQMFGSREDFQYHLKFLSVHEAVRFQIRELALNKNKAA